MPTLTYSKQSEITSNFSSWLNIKNWSYVTKYFVFCMHYEVYLFEHCECLNLKPISLNWPLVATGNNKCTNELYIPLILIMWIIRLKCFLQSGGFQNIASFLTLEHSKFFCSFISYYMISRKWLFYINLV